MLGTWLKSCGKVLYKCRVAFLMAAVIVSLTAALDFSSWKGTFWKSLAIAPEPEICSVCQEGDGIRYHAPVLVNLSTGRIRELKIYDNDPRMPWEVAEEQRWDDWVFTVIDDNATMSWSSVDHTNVAHIGEGLEKFNPSHFCRDCRALLAETGNRGYAILDLYDLGNIQAFAVKAGSEYTIRDYTVSIYKDSDNGGLTVEVTGHLFCAG